MMAPLRKKGGRIIKKISIFLITIIGLLLCINVKAETVNFYEAEYIDGIYINKYNAFKNTIDYQKARFFRRSDTNEFAYCIEPFNYFRAGYEHEITNFPNNANPERIDRIRKLAHFGYGYQNHTDAKWYAITQVLIWETAEPEGDYYFTQGIVGERINPYQAEIDEINYLIEEYSKMPSFANQTFYTVEGQDFILTDTNNSIQSFTTNDPVSRINNQLKWTNTKAGNYHYTFQKEDTFYNKPLLFYQSDNTQNLVTTGDIESIHFEFNIKVIQTSLEITKIDKDTKSITPRGEAKLDGAIYELLDSNKKVIQEITIENNQVILNNLNFGKYYIKEKKPGIGYTLDTNEYEITITKEKPTIELILENKVIEKKIRVEKKYGEDNNFQKETNIIFHILNQNNEFVLEATTNEEGFFEIQLPYGTYQLIQINTTDGYQKIDDYQIIVSNTEDELIELKDLKIPIPNTHKDKQKSTMPLSILYPILIGILWKRKLSMEF